MDIFKVYVKQRRYFLSLFGLFAVIFLSTFFLYGLPLKAVIYPIILCGVVSVIFFVWDIRKVKQNHKRLVELTCLPAQLMQLPLAQTQEDADYQEIIKALQQEQNQLQTDMTIRYQDMVDYYTIWAHQIKTPIASMRLTLQNEDSALARQMSEEVQRIEQYVEMVLVFLRLDSDSRDYVFREYELDTIIRDAVKKFAGQFIRKKLKLNLNR